MIDNWCKASYSANNAACVETGWAEGMVGYRDSKQAGLPVGERPTLVVSEDAARAFLAMIKSMTR